MLISVARLMTSWQGAVEWWRQRAWHKCQVRTHEHVVLASDSAGIWLASTSVRQSNTVFSLKNLFVLSGFGEFWELGTGGEGLIDIYSMSQGISPYT